MLAVAISRFRTLTERLRSDDRGAGLVEYALLLALIAVVCFGAVAFFGGSTEGGFGKSKGCIEAAYNNTPKPENCE